jgi:hypothetical protein
VSRRERDSDGRYAVVGDEDSDLTTLSTRGSAMTSSLFEAFGRIRAAAEEYMDERDQAGLGWVEESVTNIAVHKGLPDVRVVQFSNRQEGGGCRG